MVKTESLLNLPAFCAAKTARFQIGFGKVVDFDIGHHGQAVGVAAEHAVEMVKPVHAFDAMAVDDDVIAPIHFG